MYNQTVFEVTDKNDHRIGVFRQKFHAEKIVKEMNAGRITRICRRLTKMTGTVRGKNVDVFFDAVREINDDYYTIEEIRLR
jgi:sorbitol-specific phosphotransferase system component IIBC